MLVKNWRWEDDDMFSFVSPIPSPIPCIPLIVPSHVRQEANKIVDHLANEGVRKKKQGTANGIAT